MFRKLASAILFAGVLGSSQADALGLGELTMRSALNEPLDGEIKLLSVGDLTPGQVIVNLGSAEDFERAGVDRDYFLTNLKFEVQLDGKGNGVIHIRTHSMVNEPYLNFIIEARWPAGKLLREYTALLDLPIYTERAAAQVNLGSAPGSSGSAVSRPAPQSAPVAQSAPEATGYSGGESYEIRRADTLWKIAQRTRPAGDVSLEQTMLAIQQLNPNAFINGNINLLRQGAVLRLPSADQAKGVNTGEARSAIASQSRAWRQKSETGADTTDTLPVVREPQAESDGRLTLSSAGAGTAEGSGAGAADTAQLKGKLDQSLENLDRAERDNADLKSRVTQMQDQVVKLQRLVQLKDEQMAALQKRAAASDAVAPVAEEVAPQPAPEAAVPATPEPAPEVAATPAPAPAATEQPVTVEQPATTEQPAAESTPATPAVEPAPIADAVPPAVTPAKPKPVVKPPAPVAQPGLLDMVLGNPLYLGGGAALLLLIIAGLVLRQRAAQRDAEMALASPSFDEPSFDHSFDDVDQQGQDVVGDIADEQEFEEETVEQPAVTQTRSETGDAIGEADIYVAYGRYQHAIDLLKNAISTEPGRSDLRVKLLEVYLEAGDRDGFRSQFAALQSLGDADATGRAKEMLMSVDDGNAWIGEATAFDPDATMPTGLRVDSDHLDSDNTMERPAITDEDLDDLELGDDLDDADTSWTSTDEPDELPEVDTSAQTASLDELDLDLGLDDDLETTAGGALLEDEELALDIDDLSSDLPSSDDTLLLDKDADSLNFASDSDFELATELDAEETLDAGGLGDSELSRGGDSLTLPEEDDAELVLDGELESETVETGFSKNLDDIDAEIGAFDAESLQAASELSLGEDEEFDFLSDSDEVATKLDLARAYIDMGDIDGARDILQEVLQEGEAPQKDEANKLLARIA